jgi:acyl-[acyl-carrier-protein] desaturase
MKLNPSRIEVMKFLAQKIDAVIGEFLKNIDTNWQPSDFLPESNNQDFTKNYHTITWQFWLVI